jgi:hypothetical protein
MTDISKQQTDGADERPYPRPPGGGSWTFDEESWSWKSNDPQPEEPADAQQAPQNDMVEEPVHTGDDFQQPQDSQE